MIPVDNSQTITMTGVSNSVGRITVTAKNIPFLINAVTDRIYKDKPLAVVREFSTNAFDAHVQARLPIEQIEVTLPTLANSMFQVRDFGSGLTMEEIRDIYCILGESTKRGSNDLNGQLGLGAKSFAGYGDSMIVTSWVNGKKTIYNIIKGDDHKEGDVIMMGQEDMAEGDRTGIEVAVPVKTRDLSTFHSKAAEFFKYWPVLPTINRMDAEYVAKMDRWRNEVPFLSGDGWQIRPDSSSYGSPKSVAFMGQVAYPIDWGMLSSKLALTPQKRILLEILQSNEVVLNFPIGSLKFTINREELEYTETTFTNLETKVEAIFAALDGAVKSKFANAKSIWEAKRIYLALFGRNLGDKDEDGSGEDKTLKVLDGDFYRLEDTFKGKIVWNGINITSPHFALINRFDMVGSGAANDTDALCYEPITPIMTSFQRKKKRVKKLRCHADKDNRITPYNGTKVIIIDGRNVSLTQTIARYFLLREGTGVNKVHILRFRDDVQKQEFFNHYNFETAQFTYLSTILNEVKEWQKLNRRSYDRTGGGGGGTALLKYIDVESGEVKTEDVAIRDLVDGGVYLTYSRKDGHLGNRTIPMEEIGSELATLAKHADMDLDRVYCLPEAKIDAKWFQRAMADGLWTDLHKFLRENGEVVVTDEMKRQYHFSEATDSADPAINYAWAKALADGLKGMNPEFNDYLDEVVAHPTSYGNLTSALEFFELPELDFGNISFNYKALGKSIMAKYPMLQWMNVNGYNDVSSSKLTTTIDYIEAVDASKKLLTTDGELV